MKEDWGGSKEDEGGRKIGRQKEKDREEAGRNRWWGERSKGRKIGEKIQTDDERDGGKKIGRE